MRLADARMQFAQRVAHVGEAMMLTTQRVLQVFLCELCELLQHHIETVRPDRVQAHMRCGDGRKSYLVETEVVLQVTEDSQHVRGLRGQRHPRGNGARSMPLEQLPDFRFDDVDRKSTRLNSSHIP